jgi:hypothetical protein
MQHLFGPDGEAALAAALRQRPLLAFDFDGTLTPIVARAEDARLSAAVSARLKALATQLPLAIVTGRAVADVRDRLGFEPQFLMGSHGAEDPRDPAATAARTHCLDTACASNCLHGEPTWRQPALVSKTRGLPWRCTIGCPETGSRHCFSSPKSCTPAMPHGASSGERWWPMPWPRALPTRLRRCTPWSRVVVHAVPFLPVTTSTTSRCSSRRRRTG